MENKPIALIMPVYKAHGFIRRALSSIACQTRLDLVSVYLSVDGEQIGSYNYLLNEFPSLELQILYNAENRGPGMARQSGLDKIIHDETVEYVTFMDCDDVLYNPFSIELLYHRVKQDPSVVLLAGNFIEQTKDGYFVERHADKVFLHGKVYMRSALEKYDIHFDDDLLQNEDIYFNRTLLFLKDEKENMGAINDIVYAWLWNDNSIVRKNNEEAKFSSNSIGYVKAVTKVAERVFKDNKVSDSFNEWIVFSMADIYLFDVRIKNANPEFVETYRELVKYFYHNVFLKIDSNFVKENETRIVADKIFSKNQLSIGYLPSMTYQDYKELIANA